MTIYSYKIQNLFLGMIRHLSNISTCLSVLNTNVLIDAFDLSKKNKQSFMRQKEERFNKLMLSLEEYEHWLNNNKIDLFNQQILVLINSISDHRDEYKNKDEYSLVLLNNKIVEISNFSNIVANIIKKYLDDKLTHIKETIDEDYFDFEKEKESINTIYKELIKTSSGKQKTFIKSSYSSFKNGIIQFERSYYERISFSSKEESKEYIISDLIGSLFLLYSSYEKIFFSIAYLFDCKINENNINRKAALEHISKKNEILHRKLNQSITNKDICAAQDRRNSETHRISHFKLGMLKGNLISLISEIHNILNIYHLFIKNSNEKKD